jgi:hypothetical protein
VTRDVGDHLDLTICTVSNRGSVFVEHNVALARALNEGNEPTWIVVENAQSEPIHEFGSRSVVAVRGPAPDRTHGERARGSYHHAAGLQRALDLTESRFVLVLDPDFYIVREQWVTDVICHMDRLALAFFGVPWHPRWIGKARYFPAPHCLFIDTERVPRSLIDFTPEISSPRRAGEGAGETGFRGAGERLRERFRRLAPVRALGVRRSIAGSRDTGFRIYRAACARADLRVECALPVFDPETDLSHVPWASAWWSRLADVVLPDHLRIEPRRRASYSTTGFSALGAPDTHALGWEEFIWQARPFGFHLRWNQLATAQKDMAQGALTDVLGQVMRRARHMP